MIISFLRVERGSRKCRNWQTSKTKDLVIIAIVWVQVPSSAENYFLEKALEFNVLGLFSFALKTTIFEVHGVHVFS